MISRSDVFSMLLMLAAIVVAAISIPIALSIKGYLGFMVQVPILLAALGLYVLALKQ